MGQTRALARTDQLAALKQGLPNHQSVSPLGLSAGVEKVEDEENVDWLN